MRLSQFKNQLWWLLQKQSLKLLWSLVMSLEYVFGLLWWLLKQPRGSLNGISPIMLASDNTHFKLSWFVTEGHPRPRTCVMVFGKSQKEFTFRARFSLFPFLLSFLLSSLFPFYSPSFLLLSFLPSFCPPSLLSAIPLSSLFPSDQEIQNSCTPGQP